MCQSSLPFAGVRWPVAAGSRWLATSFSLNATARFGFPEVKIGFVPAMVMAILRRSASEKKAFELITTGVEISADEAAQFGLVNHVFESDEFDSEVEAFAQRFVKMSRSALSLSKKLFYSTDGLSFPEALAAGVDINATARMTKDCRAGVARFLEK